MMNPDPSKHGPERAYPYYPLLLDLRGRVCLVVGGGEVACRKAEGLLNAGAQVRAVALAFDGMPPAVQQIQRAFRPADIEGCALVIAATNDHQENAAIAEAARRQGVWVNAVDDPKACDFILPATVVRGDLILAISSNGQSPLLVRRIREQLENLFGSEYATLASLLGRLRRQWLEDPAIQRMNFEQRRAVWEEILDLPLIPWLQAGQIEQTESMVSKLLAKAIHDAEAPPQTGTGSDSLGS